MKKLRRKLLDLMAKRKEHLDAADTALEGNDQTAFDAAMQAVSDLDKQIKNVNALIAAQEAIPAAPPAGTGDPAASDTIAQLRASNEYVRAFCGAVRARISPALAQNDERFSVLMNALTEGVDEDGGFLVPVDLQTRINELRRQFVSLRDLVTVEPVTTLTGYRVLDSAPTKGFTLLAEMGNIPMDDQPVFSRLNYSCKDYGLIVPVSNDLMNDNDAGLMEYLARWMAKKAVLTENKLILAVLTKMQATTVAAGGELAAIKRALNVTLDPDIALNAAVLTNQIGYDCLDQLVDGNGRPLLQPDITAGSGYQIKQKPVKYVADRLLANTAAGAPLYVGDFKSFITLFDRQVMEFTTTNIGGNAWRSNSTEGRAIMRLDLQQMDAEAVAALALAGGLEAQEPDDGGDDADG